MLVFAQNLGVKRIIPRSNNIANGKQKKECDKNNKTNLQVQNVVDKNNLQDTEVSTEIIFIISSNSI